jgi:hypothetical protein
LTDLFRAKELAMTKFITFGAWTLMAAMVVLAVSSTPGYAQNSSWRSFVSSAGNDANNCKLATPCASIARAVTVTPDTGTITCLDPHQGNYGVYLDKSMTIDCEGGSLYLLTISLPPTATAVIRGLAFDNGNGSSVSVLIAGAGSVVLDRVRVFRGSVACVDAAPTGPLGLTIVDSAMSACGSGSTGAGVLVKPQPGGSARVTLERTHVSASVFGVAIDGSNSSTGINATVSESVLSNNSQVGLVATSSAGHAPIGVLATGVKSVNNSYGIRAIGPGVTVRVKNSEIAGNGIGVATSGGGALLSASNNILEANGTNGALTSHLSPK